MFNISPEEFGQFVAELINEATAPLKEQISDLQKTLAERKELSADEVVRQIDVQAIVQRAAALIPSPKDGAPGKDADMDAIKSHVEALVKAIPAPQDGQSITVDDVAPLIREEVAKAIAAIPAPKDGKSVTVDDVRPILSELVSDAVKSLPPAPAGKDGKDADMEALRAHLDLLVKAIPMPQGPSADEVAAKFERRFSDLVLSWERQARDTFERAVDRMPRPKDGRDAIPLESFEMTLGEDGRTVTVKMQAGETVLAKSVKLPAIIDKGVYSKEGAYEKGDGTTYGGCFWIAQTDNPEGVPGNSKDWRLAVKKGRDGKDLRESASRIESGAPVKIRGDQ